jgi:hypothetical protein
MKRGMPQPGEKQPLEKENEMITRRILMALLIGSVCMRFACAAPEPTPKETKGQITGKITAKNGGKITVKGEEGQLTLMPYWRGGLPKDGGGFDKDMLKQLEQLSVGDKVRVTWVFEEHYRITKIEKLEKEAKERETSEPEGKEKIRQLERQIEELRKQNEELRRKLDERK